MQTQLPDGARSLKEIISTIQVHPWDYVLYLKGNPPWDEQTMCIVLDPNDTESDDPDEEPERAKELGLKSTLGVSEVQEIVANAKSQTPDVDTKQLIHAFNFYYTNDAFMEFKGTSAA